MTITFLRFRGIFMGEKGVRRTQKFKKLAGAVYLLYERNYPIWTVCCLLSLINPQRTRTRLSSALRTSYTASLFSNSHLKVVDVHFHG